MSHDVCHNCLYQHVAMFPVLSTQELLVWYKWAVYISCTDVSLKMMHKATNYMIKPINCSTCDTFYNVQSKDILSLLYFESTHQSCTIN